MSGAKSWRPISGNHWYCHFTCNQCFIRQGSLHQPDIHSSNWHMVWFDNVHECLILHTASSDLCASVTALHSTDSNSITDNFHNSRQSYRKAFNWVIILVHKTPTCTGTWWHFTDNFHNSRHSYWKYSTESWFLFTRTQQVQALDDRHCMAQHRQQILLDCTTCRVSFQLPCTTFMWPVWTFMMMGAAVTALHSTDSYSMAFHTTCPQSSLYSTPSWVMLLDTMWQCTFLQVIKNKTGVCMQQSSPWAISRCKLLHPLIQCLFPSQILTLSRSMVFAKMVIVNTSSCMKVIIDITISHSVHQWNPQLIPRSFIYTWMFYSYCDVWTMFDSDKQTINISQLMHPQWQGAYFEHSTRRLIDS